MAALFAAARAEFKHLEFFYFHNCVYESLWKDNARRHDSRTATLDVLHTFGPDYRLILVGDASMSPYEIVYPGGSVEHMNEESGEVWMQRLLAHFRHAVWLNPLPQAHWPYVQSVGMLRQLMQERMCPLTLDGLTNATRWLRRTP